MAKKRGNEGREKKREERKGKKRKEKKKKSKNQGARENSRSAAHFPLTLLMKIFIPYPLTFSP
jgi:hypothetical protein